MRVLRLKRSSSVKNSVFGDGDDQDRARARLALAGGVPRVQYVQDDVCERHEQRLRKRSSASVFLYRHSIERIARALLARDELSADEIDAILIAEGSHN
jgi:hypothetical protein